MTEHSFQNGIFIYLGGRVPDRLKLQITRAVIDDSVSSIDDFAFYECPHLRDVQFHRRVRRVGREAFAHCPSLLYLRMPGVRIIEDAAFFDCQQLIDVDFGTELEIIKFAAFSQCISLRFLRILTIKEIGVAAFFSCEQLLDAEFGEALEKVEQRAFHRCFNLRRVAIPLKKGILDSDVFNFCENLMKVTFIGNIHKTVSYLSMQSWRDDIEEQFRWIDRFLPSISSSLKTLALQQWIEKVLEKIDYYKAEHQRQLKMASAELELILWRTKLEEDSMTMALDKRREDCRIVCKADIVIPNVTSYLAIMKD